MNAFACSWKAGNALCEYREQQGQARVHQQQITICLIELSIINNFEYMQNMHCYFWILDLDSCLKGDTEGKGPNFKWSRTALRKLFSLNKEAGTKCGLVFHLNAINVCIVVCLQMIISFNGKLKLSFISFTSLSQLPWNHIWEGTNCHRDYTVIKFMRKLHAHPSKMLDEGNKRGASEKL